MTTKMVTARATAVAVAVALKTTRLQIHLSLFQTPLAVITKENILLFPGFPSSMLETILLWGTWFFRYGVTKAAFADWLKIIASCLNP